MFTNCILAAGRRLETPLIFTIPGSFLSCVYGLSLFLLPDEKRDQCRSGNHHHLCCHVSPRLSTPSLGARINGTVEVFITFGNTLFPSVVSLVTTRCRRYKSTFYRVWNSLLCFWIVHRTLLGFCMCNITSLTVGCLLCGLQLLAILEN